MSVEIEIQDVTAESLNFDQTGGRGLGPLAEFFQFGKYPRAFSKPSQLRDCYFSELFINCYVKDWSSNNLPPHPGIFEEFFQPILSRLTGPGNILTLYVKSIDPSYFEELEVIKTLLAPRNLSYILLSNPFLPQGQRTQLDFGHLLFEWPTDSLDYVVENWFMSPIVSVEGYISPQRVLGRLAELYFQADTEERIRTLLRAIDIGFRVWPDNNGLFLLSDKLDSNALRERLRASELAMLLEEASHRYC